MSDGSTAVVLLMVLGVPALYVVVSALLLGFGMWLGSP